MEVSVTQSPAKLTTPMLQKEKEKINVLVLLMAKIVQINHPWLLDIVNGVILHSVLLVECQKYKCPNLDKLKESKVKIQINLIKINAIQVN